MAAEIPNTQNLSVQQNFPEQHKTSSNKNFPFQNINSSDRTVPQSSASQPVLPLRARPPTPPLPLKVKAQSQPQYPTEGEVSSTDSGYRTDDENSLSNRSIDTETESYIELLDICEKLNNSMFCLEGNGLCGCKGDCCLRYCVILWNGCELNWEIKWSKRTEMAGIKIIEWRTISIHWRRSVLSSTVERRGQLRCMVLQYSRSSLEVVMLMEKIYWTHNI